MINLTLYKCEMKGSIKLLIIFGMIISMYVAIIISMYDPEMMASLDQFYELMPEVMSAVGMSAGATTLIGFMISYLYGFIFVLFPMLFCILRGNGLVAKYADRGSLVTLMTAPVKRKTIAITQMSVLISGILFLVLYSTGLEIAIAESNFPGELVISELLRLNGALICLHLFIGAVCFLASCLFSDTKYSIAFGAGIPTLMYILQMLANTGEKAEVAKYFTFFTLFDANGIVVGEVNAVISVGLLGIGAVILYTMGITVFCQKDLHI